MYALSRGWRIPDSCFGLVARSCSHGVIVAVSKILFGCKIPSFGNRNSAKVARNDEINNASQSTRRICTSEEGNKFPFKPFQIVRRIGDDDEGIQMREGVLLRFLLKACIYFIAGVQNSFRKMNFVSYLV